jgi:dipeptidyl-peptidase-4
MASLAGPGREALLISCDLMKRLLVCFLLTLPLCAADKKPVTLDDLGGGMRNAGGGPRPVSPVWAPDDKRFAYIDDGKLMLFDIPSKAKRELVAMKQIEEMAAAVPEPETSDWTNRRVSERPIQWFSSGDKLLVSSGGDVFVVHLDPADAGKAKVDQLTNTPVQEYDPKLSPDNKYVSFRRIHDLYVLEIATKKVTRLTINGTDTLLNAELDWVYPEELELGTAHWWSPDSKHIAYLQLDTSEEPVFPQVFLLKSRGLLEPERYPKSGDPNAEARVGVVSVEGGDTKWMDLGETRDYLIARVTWLPDSSAVTAMRLNRIQNNLDLLRADISSGESSVLLHERDPYWINVEDEPHFLANGKEFIWESERGEGGFRHFYLYGMDGKLKHPITKGDWAVERLLTVDEDSGHIYYMSSEDSPLESHLYEVDLSGKHRKRMTSGSGVHGVSISPHGAYFTDSFSNLTTPPSQTLRDASGAGVMEWSPANRSAIDKYALSESEIVQVPAGDGQIMYGRLLKPVPFDPTKKYPVIVQVYGGPHAQTVRNQWHGVGMDQVFASAGYVVWSLDNRGSWGRGHKWESVVFRDLGKHELEDQKTGIEYLKKQGFVDPARIGITGWSYGGYMTTYSMVNAPEVFKAGCAGAPVTSWRNYDSIYTERYMGLPSVNKDNYDSSSPQTHAAQLQGKLLILHNVEDDNVHFQNTLQMAEALEKANKQFRMVVYPQKSHGVFGPYSKSLNSTMLAFFEENLK